jgi:carotenoid cleavage dioxygenase-like enzyme
MSDKRRAERASGEAGGADRAIYRTFGTAFPGDKLVHGIMLASPVNVSVAPWGGRLLAFGEQGLPYELDRVSLETRGPYTFDGKLLPVSPFSAHPKIDPETGVLYNFGVSFASREPSLSFYGFSPDGSTAVRQRAPLPYASSMHDFAISERWAAFFVSPYVLDVQGLRHEGRTLLECLEWRPSESSWWLILDRETGAEAGRWPVPAAHCLHLIHATDRPDGTLVVDILELDGPAYPHYQLPDLYRQIPGGRAVRWRIDPRRGPLGREERSTPLSPDFPATRSWEVGRATRSTWLLGISHSARPGRKFFDEIARLDLETGSCTDRWRPPAGRYLAGEPAVAELDRETLHDYSGESNVAILVPIWGPQSGSEIAVFDGAHIAQGPVARIELERPLPLLFHSTFEQHTFDQHHVKKGSRR